MIIFILLLLLSVPFILNGIYTNESPTAWIGFWGSFAGGILGTLGVIYVAHIQSKQQRELNEKQSEEQRELNEKMLSEQRAISNKQMADDADRLERSEKYNRERLRIETQVRIIEEYIETLKALQDDLYVIKFGLVELIGFNDLRKVYQEEKVKDVLQSSESLKDSAAEAEYNYLEIKKRFNEYGGNYFTIRFEDIFYRNIVLKDKGIGLSTTDSSFHGNLDDIISQINSKLKELDVNILIEKYADNSNYFPDVEEAWKWVRNEKSNAYMGLIELIDKL